MITEAQPSQIQCPNCLVKTARPRQATTATCSNCGKSVALDDRVFDQRYVFGGEVLTRGRIIVGPRGQVKANLSGTEVIVEGSVEGDVKAVDKLYLGKNGKLSGNVAAGSLVMEEGAILRGKVTIGD